MRIVSLGFFLCTGGIATIAAASVTTSFSGTLDGTRTFDRPAVEGYDIEGLTNVGVPYDAVRFSPVVGGNYTFSLATNVGVMEFEGGAVLYDGSFDPLAPLDNLLFTAGFDHGADPFASTVFDAAFAADQEYVFVVAGANFYDTGDYLVNAIGPGRLGFAAPPASVPEPASCAVVVGIPLLLRRRR